MENKKTKIIIEITEDVNKVIDRYQEAYRNLHNTRPPSKAAIIESCLSSVKHSLDLKVQELRAAKKELDKTKI